MAKPTIDITSYRSKLDEDFKSGKLSPREYRRLQTGMGNIANGQNQGFSYKIDPGSRTFSAEKDGEQAKGKIGGKTQLNPLAGRKTSKAIEYINSQQASQTPAPPSSEVGAGVVAETATPNQKPMGAGNVVRIGPSPVPRPSIALNPSEAPEQPASPAVQGQSNPAQTAPATSTTQTAQSPQTAQKPATSQGARPTVPQQQNPASANAPASQEQEAPARTPRPKLTQAPFSPVAGGVRYKTAEDYEKEIKRFYQEQEQASRNPTNRSFESQRDNVESGYNQRKIDLLKRELYEKFGKIYGGRIELGKGYVAPGQPSLDYRNAPARKTDSPADYHPSPIVNQPFTPPTTDRYGNKIILQQNGGPMIKRFKGGGFMQSGRELNIDLSSAINTGMGAFGLISGLTNKAPKVPTFEKLQSRIRPASGDYDSLQRNLNSADSNFSSMRRTMRDNVGSDNTSYVRGVLGAGQYRDQAKNQAFQQDSAIRVQDRNRVDSMQMMEDQYNNQGKNQMNQQKFQFDAQRWAQRAQGSQQMLNSSIQYGEDRRANLANNALAEKQANKALTFMEANLRQQMVNEFIRNNGGRMPTDQELQALLQRIIPSETSPSLFK